MNRVTVAVLGLFIAILLGSGILAYVLGDDTRNARRRLRRRPRLPQLLLQLTGAQRHVRFRCLVNSLDQTRPGSRLPLSRPGNKCRRESRCGFHSLRFSRLCSRFVRDAVFLWRGAIRLWRRRRFSWL